MAEQEDVDNSFQMKQKLIEDQKAFEQEQKQYEKQITTNSELGFSEFKRMESAGSSGPQSGLRLLKEVNLYDKYTIFYEECRADQKQAMNNIIIELPQDCIVENCIIESVKAFNEKFENNNQKLLPTDSYDNYFLFLAKKNGEKKLDYPAIDKSQLLNKTNVYNFQLCFSESKMRATTFEIEVAKQQQQSQQSQSQFQKNKSSNNKSNSNLLQNICCCFFSKK